MAQLWQPETRDRYRSAKVRAGGLGTKQNGRVTARQLSELYIGRSQIARWLAQGYLTPELPRVYGIAGAPESIEADLTSALLYAGPGAMLDGIVAGWWLGAVRRRPRRIAVATPRRCRSLETPSLFAFDGIDVHSRRSPKRVWLPRDGRVFGPDRATAQRLPVVPIDRLTLDLACALDHNALRQAIAQLEFRRLVTVDALRAACGRGKSGSSALAEAIAAHEPRLARTNSEWEDRLIFICEDHDIELPDTNTYIDGIEVDAVWRAAKLIVEIDGEGNHGTWRQIKRDRANELDLRALGYLILRYSVDLLRDHPDEVAADIQRHLAARMMAI